MQKSNITFIPNGSEPGACVVLNETPGSVRALDAFRCLVMIAISVWNLLGNTAVCIVVAKERNLRKLARNLAIASLACSDLMMIPFILFRLRTMSGVTSRSVCAFFVSHFMIGLYISILHLFLLCVDRYVAIFYPLRYKLIVTRKRMFYALSLAWILPIFNVFILPMSIDEFQAVKYRGEFLLCERGCFWGHVSSIRPTKTYRIHSHATGTILAAIPSLFIVVAYARIAKVAWYQASRARNDMPASITLRMRGTRRWRKELKWAKTVVLVIGSFVCCYVPLFCVASAAVSRGSNQFIRNLIIAFAHLAYINTCINCLIYSFRSSEYRAGFKKLFCGVRCRLSQVRDRRTETQRSATTGNMVNAQQRVECWTTNNSNCRVNSNISVQASPTSP